MVTHKIVYLRWPQPTYAGMIKLFHIIYKDHIIEHVKLC